MKTIDRQKLHEIVKKDRFDIKDLYDILIMLRAEDGCPWDKVQTHESIRINMIEEAYELVDAVDKKADDKLLEETGDVLLQVLFHTLMAEERGAFNLEDVITGICKKLILRHTHIFGEDKAGSADEALKNWDKNKVIEKGFKTAGEYVDDVPKNFPSLLRAEKVQKRASKHGLDFNNISEVYDKIAEETEEVKKAKDTNTIKDECGDLLFSVVNLARLLGVDAETALKESTAKFTRRFIKAEELAKKDNKELKDLSCKEWDNYYNASKED